MNFTQWLQTQGISPQRYKSASKQEKAAWADAWRESQGQRKAEITIYESGALNKGTRYETKQYSAPSLYLRSATGEVQTDDRGKPILNQVYNTSKFQDAMAGVAIGNQVAAGSNDPFYRLGAVAGAAIAGLFTNDLAGYQLHMQAQQLAEQQNQQALAKTQASMNIEKAEEYLRAGEHRRKVADKRLELAGATNDVKKLNILLEMAEKGDEASKEAIAQFLTEDARKIWGDKWQVLFSKTSTGGFRFKGEKGQYREIRDGDKIYHYYDDGNGLTAITTPNGQPLQTRIDPKKTRDMVLAEWLQKNPEATNKALAEAEKLVKESDYFKKSAFWNGKASADDRDELVTNIALQILDRTQGGTNTRPDLPPILLRVEDNKAMGFFVNPTTFSLSTNPQSTVTPGTPAGSGQSFVRKLSFNYTGPGKEIMPELENQFPDIDKLPELENAITNYKGGDKNRLAAMEARKASLTEVRDLVNYTPPQEDVNLSTDPERALASVRRLNEKIARFDLIKDYYTNPDNVLNKTREDRDKIMSNLSARFGKPFEAVTSQLNPGNPEDGFTLAAIQDNLEIDVNKKTWLVQIPESTSLYKQLMSQKRKELESGRPVISKGIKYVLEKRKLPNSNKVVQVLYAYQPFKQ